MGGSSAPAPAPAPAAGASGGAGLKMEGLSPPAAVESAVGAGVPRRPERGAMDLGGDGSLRVGVQLGFRPESLMVVVHVGNSGGSPVSGVQVTPQPLSFLSVRAVTAGSGDVQTDAAGAKLSAPLGPGQSRCFAMQYVIANVPANSPLQLRVSYAGAAAPLVVSVPLTVLDLLRPKPMTTPEFGGMWTNAAYGHQGSASSHVAAPSTLEAVQSLLPVRAHHHSIEGIPATQEVIASSLLMGTPQHSLLHCKLAGGGQLGITVKTADGSFTATIAEALNGKFA